jgi:hypothetical protein
MKKLFSILIAFSLFFPLTALAQGDAEFHVVPPAYTNTTGTTSFLGPLANTQRIYQLLINENQLTDIVGMDLVAISWRIPANATADWPTSEVTFSEYNIFLSESVHPSDRDLTSFSNNVVGTQTQVRSGNLVIPANSYTFGNSPNAFGPEITFNTPWFYVGGHLLIEIRHPGFTGTSRSVDAIGTAISGYGTDFSACWQGTGNISQGNFSVVRITADDPVPVELTSFFALVTGSAVQLNWITASEINNYGFEVERRSSNSNYEVVGFVAGAGSTTETQTYSFNDSRVTNGNYAYRLKQMDFDGSFEYSYEVEVDVDVPEVFALAQNYPNPFNPTTNFSFSIAEAGMVKLSVYNLLGQKVKTVLNEFKEAGSYNVTFDASSLTSGTYFYKLETPQFNQTKKMILAK